MKVLNERKLARQFLDSLNENMHMQSDLNSNSCTVCYCDPCECPDHDHDDYQSIDHNHMHGESHAPLQHGEDGVINKEDLYNHFDLDNNGVVTTDEYADHIEYHAAHPESLNKYKQLRSASCQTVPCQTSYDSCGSYCISDPESMQTMLQPILAATGATCQTSAIQSILDVLKSLKDCGIV